MKGHNLMLLIAFLVIIVVIFKVKSKESFGDYTDVGRFNGDGSPMSESTPDIEYKPYLNSGIYDLDNYELSSVYQNQGSRVASQKEISDAMTRYPMDWPVQGAGSQYFQENQAEYQKKSSDGLLSDTVVNNTYQEVDGSDMAPTDLDAQDEEERKILQTYVPKKSKNLLQYSPDDVRRLVDKVYAKKGLVPVIEKSKQGENIWEITELKEKNPKIVWEDEVTTRDIMMDRGEEVIQVPYTATDIAMGLDPYYNPRMSTRKGRNDYTQWTSGLERMFAPTYPLKSWF
jgi:hypothetical protein